MLRISTIRTLFLCLAVGSCFTVAAPGISGQAETRRAGLSSTPSTDPVALERAKFEFQQQLERERLQLEREKLGMEQLKVWLTMVSVLAPLIGGLLVLHLQLRSARQLKEQEARSVFELKAAEIVLTSTTPSAAGNKARALRDLFPGRLPDNFAAIFDPAQYRGPVYAPKVDVFKAAAAKAQSPQEVCMIWQQLFPDEHKWIQPLVCSDEREGKDQRPSSGTKA